MNPNTSPRHIRQSAPGIIAFPRFDSSLSEVGQRGLRDRYGSTLSVDTGRPSINRASALELHDLIYSNGTAFNLKDLEEARTMLDRLYEKDAVYQNPLLTASSGDVITDIYSLLHLFAAISIPTPLSVAKSFLPSFLRGKNSSVHWLNIAKVWSEVGEVLESDVYDGHRRVVIQHKVYLLFLPDLLDSSKASSASHEHGFDSSSLSLPTSIASMDVGTPGPHPATTSTTAAVSHLLTLARRFTLPVHTRLSFNDSGRITHHQDIWDIADVLALFPGVGVAQWIGSRMLATGLTTAFNTYSWASSMSGVKKKEKKRSGERRLHIGSDTMTVSETEDENGGTGEVDTLGLIHLTPAQKIALSRAPDTDI